MNESKEKVTRNDLRGIPMGCARTFKLPGAKAINSAKAIAYQLQHEEGCKFSAESDYANNCVTITKKAL